MSKNWPTRTTTGYLLQTRHESVACRTSRFDELLREDACLCASSARDRISEHVLYVPVTYPGRTFQSSMRARPSLPRSEKSIFSVSPDNSSVSSRISSKYIYNCAKLRI